MKTRWGHWSKARSGWSRQGGKDGQQQAMAWVERTMEAARWQHLSAAGFLPLPVPSLSQDTPNGIPLLTPACPPAPNSFQIILEPPGFPWAEVTPSTWYPKSSTHQSLSPRGPEHMRDGTGTQSTCSHDPMLCDIGQALLDPRAMSPPRNREHSTSRGDEAES